MRVERQLFSLHQRLDSLRVDLEATRVELQRHNHFIGYDDAIYSDIAILNPKEQP